MTGLVTDVPSANMIDLCPMIAWEIVSIPHPYASVLGALQAHLPTRVHYRIAHMIHPLGMSFGPSMAAGS